LTDVVDEVSKRRFIFPSTEEIHSFNQVQGELNTSKGYGVASPPDSLDQLAFVKVTCAFSWPWPWVSTDHCTEGSRIREKPTFNMWIRAGNRHRWKHTRINTISNLFAYLAEGGTIRVPDNDQDIWNVKSWLSPRTAF